MPRRKPPVIPDAILDQLLAGSDAKSAFDPHGLLDQLKKALAERALNAEMEHHLSTEAGAGNNRNGYGRKTVITATGPLPLDIPRDRTASFEPQLVAKHQRRLSGFDDRVIAMYARGMQGGVSRARCAPGWASRRCLAYGSSRRRAPSSGYG